MGTSNKKRKMTRASSGHPIRSRIVRSRLNVHEAQPTAPTTFGARTRSASQNLYRVPQLLTQLPDTNGKPDAAAAKSPEQSPTKTLQASSPIAQDTRGAEKAAASTPAVVCTTTDPLARESRKRSIIHMAAERAILRRARLPRMSLTDPPSQLQPPDAVQDEVTAKPHVQPPPPAQTPGTVVHR